MISLHSSRKYNLDGQNLETFLESIGWNRAPNGQQEVEEYTNAVINNLPADEKYCFIISVRTPPHPKKKHPSEFKDWIEFRKYNDAENERFEAPYKQQIIDLFDKLRIQPEDYTIYNLSGIAADLTGEQAKQVRTHTDLIEFMLADDPPIHPSIHLIG